MESIVGGTWGGEGAPEEWVDYCLMKAMGWTFDQLQDVPLYVRGYCIDFMNIEAQAEKDAADH